jgi:glycosyltransferase involved in cell wall biosynthesis
MESRKKLTVLVDTFHLFQALTGIKTYTMELCKGLERLEDNNIRYVSFPSWRHAVNTDLLRGKTSSIFKVLNHALFFFWKAMVLPIYIWIKRVDVVISPDFVAPKMVRKRVVTMPVFHDLFFWEMPQNYNPIWRPYFIWMIKQGLHPNSVIITTSNHIKSKIEGELKPNNPIEVIYQSFKSGASKLEKDSLYKEESLRVEGKYFLHVGVFDKRKNLPFLIRAFHKFYHQVDKDFFLVLAGSKGLSIKHDEWDTCQNLIVDLKLEERILMPGFVSEEQLALLYRNAYAYVFPSLEEGFGIPILEAMQNKVPVLVSNKEPLPEIGGDSVLLFDPYKIEDLVLKMEETLDSNLRDKLVEKGSKRVLEFSSSSFANNMHKMIIKHCM